MTFAGDFERKQSEVALFAFIVFLIFWLFFVFCWLFLSFAAVCMSRVCFQAFKKLSPSQQQAFQQREKEAKVRTEE